MDFLMGMILFLCANRQAQAQGEQGRVLFISSYSYGWDTVQLQIEGFIEGLAPGIAADYEFMDTKRLDVEVAQQMLYERLKYTLSVVLPYDVIVVGDDAALQFVMDYREELFAGIPIVFEGINNVQYARELAEQDPLVTGVVEELSLEEKISTWPCGSDRGSPELWRYWMIPSRGRLSGKTFMLFRILFPTWSLARSMCQTAVLQICGPGCGSRTRIPCCSLLL